MIKVTISKQNVITNQGTFKTQEEANSWVAFHESQESFGKPQHETQVLVSEAIPEVLDDEGNVIQEAVEAVYETIVTPAEYEVEIVDITEQVNQEKINAKALAYLASTDFYVVRFMEEGTPYPEEIKLARAEARAKIIK